MWVHAGALVDFIYPACGCDACDETWQSAADDLEWTAQTIVSGGLREVLDPTIELGVGFFLAEPNGASRGGNGRLQDYPADRVGAARALIPGDGRWRAWTERVS